MTADDDEQIDWIPATGFSTQDVMRFILRVTDIEQKRPDLSLETLEEIQTEHFIELIRKKGKMQPGVLDAISFFKSKGLKVGIASASPPPVIYAALDRFDLAEHFDVTVSDATLSHTKPHPLVYLTAAQRMGVDPQRCCAVEDSLTGTISAKAAKMKVISVPSVDCLSHRFGVADIVLDSLVDLSDSVWSGLWN